MPDPDPVKIRMIDHVVIRVRDTARAISFYRDVLGCRVERDTGDTGLVQLRAGDSLIDVVDIAGPIGRAGGGAPDPRHPNMDHFCVQVDPWDEEAIRRHLAGHGIDAGETVTRYGALGHGPSIYIEDPDGNTVELKGPPGDG